MVTKQKDMQFVCFNEMKTNGTPNNNNRKNRHIVHLSVVELCERISMGKQNGRSISLVYECCNNILFCRFVIEIENFVFSLSLGFLSLANAFRRIKSIKSILRLSVSVRSEPFVPFVWPLIFIGHQRVLCFQLKGVNFSLNELIQWQNM